MRWHLDEASETIRDADITSTSIWLTDRLSQCVIDTSANERMQYQVERARNWRHSEHYAPAQLSSSGSYNLISVKRGCTLQSPTNALQTDTDNHYFEIMTSDKIWLRQSIRIYWRNNPAKFHSDTIWNDGALT